MSGLIDPNHIDWFGTIVPIALDISAIKTHDKLATVAKENLEMLPCPWLICLGGTWSLLLPTKLCHLGASRFPELIYYLKNNNYNDNVIMIVIVLRGIWDPDIDRERLPSQVDGAGHHRLKAGKPVPGNRHAV